MNYSETPLSSKKLTKTHSEQNLHAKKEKLNLLTKTPHKRDKSFELNKNKSEDELIPIKHSPT
jgi:hypothetical protein